MIGQTITLKCCGCGQPVDVPLVGTRKRRPKTHLPYCERSECINAREKRRAAVQRENTRTRVEQNIDTPIVTKAALEKPRLPYRLKSVAFPVVNTGSNPAAPYGFDDNDRPILQPRSDLEIAQSVALRPFAASRVEYVPSKEIKESPQNEYSKARADYLEKVFAKSRALGGRGVNMTLVERSIVGKSLGSEKAEDDAKPQKKRELKISNFREFFRMSCQDVLALFDRVVRYEDRPVDVKVHKDKATLEDFILELKVNIVEKKESIKTRSLLWWRRNRPDETPPSKSDFQRLKYYDEKELVQCQTQLREKQKQLRNWETDPENFEIIKQFVEMPVVFGEKDPVSLTPVVQDLEYLPETRKGSEIMTHTYMKVGDPYDVNGYRGFVLDNNEDALDDPGWREWEKRVIIQAAKDKLLTEEQLKRIKKLGVRPPSGQESVDVDDSAEIQLIGKTGGASLGVGMNIRGRGDGRRLESFDASLERGKGKPESGTEGGHLSDLDSGDICERDEDE